MARLEGKVAIVTGAASGIGKASAIMFAREGARVVVADVEVTGGEETVSAIKSHGWEAIFIRTDVSVESQVEKLVKASVGKFGKIDVIFNNAGILGKDGKIEDFDESSWDRVFAVNVKSMFFTAKYAVPLMKKARTGSIINTSSMAAFRPLPQSSIYTVSKGAVLTFTKTLAIELAESNIRVNCICPYVTDTPLLPGMAPPGANLEAFKKELAKGAPLGRLVKAEDVAAAAVYLASDESSMLTGGTINVDGGRGI